MPTLNANDPAAWTKSAVRNFEVAALQQSRKRKSNCQFGSIDRTQRCDWILKRLPFPLDMQLQTIKERVAHVRILASEGTAVHFLSKTPRGSAVPAIGGGSGAGGAILRGPNDTNL